MTAIDGKMFGKLWWVQPLAARFASIDAANVGLIVQVESSARCGGPRITWRGTAVQFGATKVFASGLPKVRRCRYVFPQLWRGTIYCKGEDCYLFVIESCYPPSPIFNHKQAKVARADEKYLDFRDAVMARFPLPEIETEQ